MRARLIVASAILLSSAGGAAAQALGSSAALPHVLVYKTKKKCYKSLVPVILSADRKSVVSYPDPADVRAGSANLQPIPLAKGYLMDRRGVGLNTAYLKLTYKQYGKLTAVPTPEELYRMIKDADPITELCDCGVRDSKNNSEEALKELIKTNRLRTSCKTLK